jgi:hypothetical protein
LAPAAVFYLVLGKYFFLASFFQSRRRIFDTVSMPEPKLALKEGVSQVAGRILIAWRSGHDASLEHALEHARRLTSRTLDPWSTFEMERLEALTGAVESIERSREHQAGAAVRLLEHLAQAGQA